MLGLAATEVARAQLKSLKKTNPELLDRVQDRITTVRRDPGGRAAGRSFTLDDGTLARLATYYDRTAGADLVLIWRVESDPPRVRIIRVEHV